MFDLAIVGAGPIGLETAILAKRAGLSYVVLEKGSVVNAIRGYPTYMTFFTTSERLEIGGHPLVTHAEKPTRKEALDYYRRVADNEDLELRQYCEVVAIRPCSSGFELSYRETSHSGAYAPGPFAAKAGRTGEGTQKFAVAAGSARSAATGSAADSGQRSGTLLARKVAVATGYYDHPKLLGVPGEDLPHVSHYYDEAHPYFRRDVTIVGAGSSAADAALDLFRAGARVTMIHRGADFRHSLKYWVRPNLENRIKEGSIELHLNSRVKRITQEAVIAERAAPEAGAADGSEEIAIPADRVFLLTGYYAPATLLQTAGVAHHPETLVCDLNPRSFESSVAGLYLIGSAGFGVRTSDVFIENGIEHARYAVRDIVDQLERVPVGG